MRIKQNKLVKYRPDKIMIRYIESIGKHANVCVYSKPYYCVNIIVINDDESVTRHCYPLTKEQYDIYMAGSVEEQQKLIAKGGKAYGRSE